MKYVKWLFVVLLTSLLASFAGKGEPAEGLDVGDMAPDFEIRAASGSQSVHGLSDLKGRYVLLSFWSSYDAQSRMRNVSLNNALRALAGGNVELVSVSFDEYESVFEETVRKDGISAPFCFVETRGESSGLYRKYRLNRGFSNYLLDGDGVIIARNISVAELSACLNRNGSVGCLRDSFYSGAFVYR